MSSRQAYAVSKMSACLIRRCGRGWKSAPARPRTGSSCFAAESSCEGRFYGVGGSSPRLDVECEQSTSAEDEWRRMRGRGVERRYESEGRRSGGGRLFVRCNLLVNE